MVPNIVFGLLSAGKRVSVLGVPVFVSWVLEPWLWQSSNLHARVQVHLHLQKIVIESA